MGARVTMALAIGVSLCVLGSAMSEPSAAWEAAALSGVVKDAQGAVLPGVTVKVTGPAPPPIVVTTDANGVFAVPQLMPGRYTLTAELEGFKTATHAIEIIAGQPLRVDMTLDVGSLSETVTVSSEAALIQTSSASRAYNVSGVTFNREGYKHRDENPFHRVDVTPRWTWA